MITCCYLGHDSAYDRDLYQRLLDAVIELTEDQPVRFLATWRSYYSRTEEYNPQAFYYRAILEARERFPDRGITISYVLDTREESETWLPDSLDKRDTVLIIPYDFGNTNPNEIGERVNRQMRLLLAQADVVLRYVYPLLQGRYSQLSKFAERRGKKFLEHHKPENRPGVYGVRKNEVAGADAGRFVLAVGGKLLVENRGEVWCWQRTGQADHKRRRHAVEPAFPLGFKGGRLSNVALPHHQELPPVFLICLSGSSRSLSMRCESRVQRSWAPSLAPTTAAGCKFTFWLCS